MKLVTKLTKPSKNARRIPVSWRARPLPGVALISTAPPRAQITIYEDAMVLTRRDSKGIWRSYPISPEALVQALGKLPVSAGLLPANTVGAGVLEGAPFYAQHVPAQVTHIQIDEGGKIVRYAVPLPPLIWAGWRTDYRVYALATTAALSASTRLYHTPLPNVFTSASICWGNAHTVPAKPDTLAPMLRLFLEESAFNNHVSQGKSKAHPNSVLPLLRQLATDNAEAYPLTDLQPTTKTLGNLFDGTIWRGA